MRLGARIVSFGIAAILTSTITACERGDAGGGRLPGREAPSTLDSPATITVDSVEIADDGVALVSGRVIENNRGCRTDGFCYLRLELRGREVRVVYGQGNARRCLNRDAAKQGEAVEPGQVVTVRGVAQELPGRLFVSTCGSKEFFIRRVEIDDE